MYKIIDNPVIANECLWSLPYWADLGDEELQLIQRLREWSGILYLKKDDPLSAYQNQLRTLHKLGILNLHLPSPAWEREEQLLVCFIYYLFC